MYVPEMSVISYVCKPANICRLHKMSRRSIWIPHFSVPCFSTWYRQSGVPDFSKFPDPGSRLLVDPCYSACSQLKIVEEALL